MEHAKATESEVRDVSLNKSEDLCKLAEMLGYGRPFGQLQCSNGAYVSSLLDFFDDNPGAMEAIHSFILDNVSAYDLEPDPEEEEEVEEDESI